MFDELERLCAVPELCALLGHYADLGKPDRQAWQDRRMEMPGVAGRELVKLHGELLAYGWLEQNTGITPAPRPGQAPGCYRITPAGQRALKEARAGRAEAA
jgi:hypothetical protein